MKYFVTLSALAAIPALVSGLTVNTMSVLLFRDSPWYDELTSR